MNHMDELQQLIDGLTANALAAYLNPTDAILAATYPPACQTCDGTGRLLHFYAGEVTRRADIGPCPDCPTIAQLLAWGVAVATAEKVEDYYSQRALVRIGAQENRYAWTLLDAIRAAKP